MNYVAPWWLPGGHAQTIWPALGARAVAPGVPNPALTYRRERWDTPDGDFIDLDWQDAAPAALPATLLVLFHGLEGSSRSHYALAFAAWARQKGIAFVVPHFRGCSGEVNRTPRAYHSGDFEEIGWILQRLRALHAGRLLAVGVSLGGNALLRWAEEAGGQAARCVSALASISAPLNLAASGHAIGRGLNRHIYTRRFLATMKPRALQKLAQFPGLFDAQALRAARDLRMFDDVFTAPLHGFKNAQDYWQRASAQPHLAQIQVSTLVVNARNDPFVPAHSLPQAHQVGAHVTLWQPAGGGHVGFACGRPPGHLQTLPQQVGGWLVAAGGGHG
ncbi:MAG: alpha/beta hydrolase [Comamonadaceae bacterium CG1_02_60_18]|nr:MAG: alpha/beta hydrolase [Comamonadaceae bacterium CG1_02_60_18]PIQ56439.1 MAG: alpha/beta hydrolase [Comamonadaceae bacterium CG12_big_fil_rev_8_21_14_0_65_59_15]